MYKEVGQLCHVKATNGLVRDASDPLLPEDRIELGINHTDPIAATTPDPGTSVFDVNLDVRLVQRVEELQKTFSGDKTCVSDIKRKKKVAFFLTNLSIPVYKCSSFYHIFLLSFIFCLTFTLPSSLARLRH